MERNNNNRYPYMRRQGSQHGHGQSGHTNNSHYSSNNSNNNSGAGSSTSWYAASNSAPSTSNTSAAPSTSTSTSTAAVANNSPRNAPAHHEELIRFLKDTYARVRADSATVICKSEAHHSLKNFTPVNLEELFSKRTQTTSSKTNTNST